MTQPCLDVFCHCLPPPFCQAANRLLTRPLLMFERAQKMPVMVDLEARFRVMDQFPGYRQILNLASPTIESIAEPRESPELARIGNDALAAIASKHRDRFPGFIASLPMNNPEAALAEAGRAVRELGALGVQVYTNVNGRPLDQPEYLEIFGAMARLGRPVWLHPVRSMMTPDYAGEKYSKFDLWWAFGWPYESSLAMGRLVFAGIFDRFPELVIITHHVGGMIPMMEGRIESGLSLLGTRTPPEHADAARTDLKEPPLRAFRRFYADTASFGSPAAIECGRGFFGLDRLLFATDMPFDPEQGPGYIRDTLRAIGRMDLTAEERKAILWSNAQRVLKLDE